MGNSAAVYDHPITSSSTARIQFDEPEKRFVPGDTVSGDVFISNSKPLSARFVKLTCSGTVTTKGFRNGTQKCEYSIFKTHEIAWVSEDGKNKMNDEEYRFRFCFQLPSSDCHPSFNSKYAKIKYLVSAEICRPWRRNILIRKEFFVTNKTVVVPSTYFDRSWTNRNTIIKSPGLVSDGPAILTMLVPKMAFKAGESFTIQMTIDNKSSRPVTQVMARLYVRSHNHARPQKVPCNAPKDCPLEKKLTSYTSHCISKRFVEVVEVSPHSEVKKTPFEFTLPEVVETPSFNSPLVSIQYTLTVYLKFGNEWSDASISIPVSIGENFEIEKETEDLEDKRKFLVAPPPPPYAS